MTPRLVIPLALTACAARPAPAPSAIVHAPRAVRAIAPHDPPVATPEPARNDAPALVTRARCVDDRLALAAPTPTTEVRCPWGAPDCEGEGAIVLRNCGRAHVKVTALTVLGGSSFGRSLTFTYDPQAFGALEPFTELRVPFPMPPYVDTFEALADVARGPRGVPQALRATTSVRRDALLPPGTSEALGDDASLYAVEAAPDGRWVALCTMRGAELRASLWREGEPAAIDDLLGSDPGGRFLALVIAGRALVRDTTNDVDVALDVGDTPPTRADVSFDADGRRMAYVRRRGGRARVVVRSLETAQEAEIDPGDGRLWRASLDEGGAWVKLEVIAHDTNGDGRLSLPYIFPPPPTRWCERRVSSCVHTHNEVDERETRVAPAAGSTAVAVPGLLRVLGDALLVRSLDGALELLDASGARAEFAPASCGAEILDGDRRRQQILTLCAHESQGDQAPAAFFSLAGRRDTGASFSLRVASFRAFHEAPSGVFHDGGSTWVIDHAGARLRRLSGVQGVRWSREGRVILEHGGALALFDAALEALTALPTASVFPWPRGSGPVVAVGRTLVDVAERRVLGRVAGDVLAVTADGRALVPAAPASGRWGLAAGPLRWVRPTP